MPPSTSVIMQNMYLDLFQPVFFPSPSEFSQPILDSFVAAQDELLEDNSLSTIAARTREISVDLDGAIREFRRNEAATMSTPEESTMDTASLSEVRKLRLRARMQTQSGAASGMSREQVLRKATERRERFDAEMTQLEEAALTEFKEGIRRAVAASAR
ncbi:hypothetical protein FPQ18DRAFT_306132 [Pyronema domesticum]|nr:hypothetical protein FPQ18DRAFT_306132 [Pyronema domesticum]